MSKKKVQLVGGISRQVDIEVNATIGGTIGTDILNADGTLFDPNTLATTIIKTVAAAPVPVSGITAAMYADILALKTRPTAPTGAFLGALDDGGGKDWPFAIPGASGPPGAPGLTIPGLDGDQGEDGWTIPGSQGPQGPAGAGATVPVKLAAGTTFTVPVDTQALFSIPIQLMAGAVLNVQGYLVEVH